MKIIKFPVHAITENVDALKEGYAKYEDEICFAYKQNTTEPILIFTTNESVAKHLFEINKECEYINDVDGFFIHSNIQGYMVSNPDLIRTYNL